jgi:ATP-dependent DNA helicase RecG
MSNIKSEFQGITKSTQVLLAGNEDRDLDFKSKSNNIDAVDIVAFANGQGGTILVGVEDSKGKNEKQVGKIVGCSIDDETRISIISKATSCRPSIDIRISVENLGSEKPILRIDIPEGDKKPYCTSSGMYKTRADGRNIAIDPSMMRAMILDIESAQFLKRFKSAGDELVDQINYVHKELVCLLLRVEQAANDAKDAADDASMYAATM